MQFPIRSTTWPWLPALLALALGCGEGADEPGSGMVGGSGGGSGGLSAGSGGSTAGPGGAGGSALGGAGGSVTAGQSGGPGGTGGMATAGNGGQAGSAGPGGAGGATNPDPEGKPDAGGAPAADGGPASNAALDERCTVPVTFRNQAGTNEGARIFTQEFPQIEATMQAHARRICNILYRRVDEVKNVQRQGLTIDTHDGVAFASGGNINFSANYIGNFARGKNPAAITLELNGVLVHESVHVWQYTNGGGWLVEAMADYVRYKAGFDRIERRGPGGNWDSPYTTGGFFIVWIEEKYDKDFGYKVNMGMRENGFEYAELVEEVTGKNIDDLWDEYQDDIR